MASSPLPLRLPPTLIDVSFAGSEGCDIAAKTTSPSGAKRKSDRTYRNSAMIEAIVLNGLRICELLALRQSDVDLENLKIRRNGDAAWLPLRTNHLAAWQSLAKPHQKHTPFFPSMSRVTVWRVLRAAGDAIGLNKPLTSRRARKMLGYALGRLHALPVRTLGVAMGVHDPRSLRRYLEPINFAEIPTSPYSRHHTQY